MANKNHVLAGTFDPDKNENIFNDTTFGAVIVHDQYTFNSTKCFGVIELFGTDDERPSAKAVVEEMEDPPTCMTAEGARKLAAILIKAADKADEMNKGREPFMDEDA